MNKLSIMQIMKLAEKLDQIEWISTLIKLNNEGKLEEILEIMDKKDLIQEVLKSEKKSRNR